MTANSTPNIVIVIPHDLGDHLGCYGHDTVRSPNLDAMAATGVRFTNCFTTAPECTASRSGLMTGLYTHQNGLLGLSGAFGWELRPDVSHLAKLLSRGGYTSHLFGFQHETGSDPTVLGYDNIHSKGKYKVDDVCDSFVDFLKSDESKSGNPWFAYVGFFDVHRQWKEESTFAPEDVAVPPYLPDTPEIRMDLTHFHQNIQDMDTAVGRVIDQVRSSEHNENTLFIFTTDHGSPFPGAKSTFYDPGIRVPLIVSLPGRFDSGRTSDELISNLDVCPFVLEAAGVDVPDRLEGRSFLALLENRDYSPRDAVYGALYYDVSYDPMHYVRTSRYKYIKSFGVSQEAKNRIKPDVQALHLAGRWIRCDDFDVTDSFSWRAVSLDPLPLPPEEELYDLEADPLEMNNLARDESAREILENMRCMMKDMMTRTDSPLLSGQVEPSPEQCKMSRHYKQEILKSKNQPPIRQRSDLHLRMFDEICKRGRKDA